MMIDTCKYFYNFENSFYEKKKSCSRDNTRRRQWHPTPVLLPGKSHGWRSLVGCSPWGRWGLDMTERLSDFTFHFHALEKEMATHSSVLAWRIPGTGEPGGLPSMQSHRVGHDWSDLAAAAAAQTIQNLKEQKCGQESLENYLWRWKCLSVRHLLFCLKS